jgi:S-methylmethionine-dependent homocysteine/selenocysteine methylase
MAAMSDNLRGNMGDYSGLRHRIDDGEVIILDGAVGTQLQGLGVPIGATAWAAVALHTHPDTVRFMHETYIKDGVDIITTNTFSSGRQCLEPLGLGDLTRELNLRAVVLAQEARDRTAKERPVYIGGAVSHYGILAGGEPLPEVFYRDWSNYTEEQCKANIREQAEILVDGGVDFLVTEATGGTLQRKWIVEACLATGVPTWIGFKCRSDEPDGTLKTGYSSDDPFADDLDEIIPLGGDLATVFHTSVDDTTRSIPALQEKWSGPIGVYPDADRHDYVKTRQDETAHNHTSPDDFLKLAQGWVTQGAQVIGGCCGFGFEYIKPLREGLPSHIPTPGSRTGTDG